MRNVNSSESEIDDPPVVWLSRQNLGRLMEDILLDLLLLLPRQAELNIHHQSDDNGNKTRTMETKARTT